MAAVVHYVTLGSTGPDTLYVADDRAITSGGGIQKWTFDGNSGTWTLATTIVGGLTTGVRGLAGAMLGDAVVLLATTNQTPPRVVRVVDDGQNPANAVGITTAPTNTAYRGVALSPTP